MALFDLFRSRGASPVARRRRRKTEGGSAILRFLERNRIVSVGVFVLTVAAIFVISFVGVSPVAFRVLPNQIATVRIVADVDFSYESAIRLERARERRANEVPPVLAIDMSACDAFEARVRELFAELNRLDPVWPTMTKEERQREMEKIVLAFSTQGGLRVSPFDLGEIMNYGDGAARQSVIERGLFVLRGILSAGVIDPDSTLAQAENNGLLMFQVKRDSGTIDQTRVESLEDAIVYLRSNLRSENIPDRVAAALVGLLRGGVRPNLKFDQIAQDELREKMLASLKAENVHVERGRSIIETGTKVTTEQLEMLQAYQQHLSQTDRLPTGVDRQTIGRILLVLGVIIVAGFYIRLEDPMTLQSNGRLALLAMVLVFGLSLVRATLELGVSPMFEDQPQLAALLPYMAPTVFAPMVIAVLIGAGPALFSGLLVSIFSAIIFGNRVEVLVLSLLTATVAAYACRAVRRRTRVVRAGLLSGLTMAAFVALLAWAEQMDARLLLTAVGGGIGTNVLTGIVVVGMLPIFESLFKRTTDITLLELTDFNHPLLRRMQMDAPGTYHHSLMVSNLSENAANAIGANALLCRVCCMFHDIGKLVKPEYFAENQRGGVNPHAEHTASFSALIIKSHVKEGVDLAVKYKLPRPVIDVIRQHHGTTLIRYFFEQARQKARGGSATPTPREISDVSESTYRYDGPRPQFKESAVILFADSVEAASRSLLKVTPQAVEDLIESIIREKIEDGQIDEAPLTIREIALIKRSFTFTLLNSLHTRVVYPKAEPAAGAVRAPATRSGPQPTPPLGSRP